MRSSTPIILGLFLAAASFAAAGDETTTYRVGAGYGLSNVRAAEKPYYGFDHSWGILLGLDGGRSSFVFSLQSQKNYSDASASGHFGFFADKDAAKRAFSSLRAGFDFDYRLKADTPVRPTIGAGLGYLIWKYVDPDADTVVHTIGDKGNVVDFSAAEMYISGAVGLEIKTSENLALHVRTSLDHLTGLGTAFSDSAGENRDRTIMRAGITLTYLFGGGPQRRVDDDTWPSSKAWETTETAVRQSSGKRDSDGDGVSDKHDQCPGTPAGAHTDGRGCPTDTDRDGVFDGLDDCPLTLPAARGYIDLFGCPIDSDFDGVPDYLDRCRQGPPGAIVDEFGCPTDGDSDGVFDGLDDCPHSRSGIEVDRRGCIDVAFLRDTMRIHIDYQPGSFEIDERTRRRLEPLIAKLRILDHVRVTIIGYTDNVGPAEANQNLSLKRANRMRDWLTAKGIAAERLTPIGRGETNFIASNQTADGRAQNRRIELIFSD